MTTAFMFPGQGSQTVGMGADWLGRSDVVKRTFEEADEALGESLSSVILEGPIEALTRTENTQPALLTVSVAYWRVLQAEGKAPDVVAGHSLGEYSALVAAGCLDFADAVRLTRLRGRAMQSAVPEGVGSMAAILMARDEESITNLCAKAAQGEVLEPAGFNTNGQTVIAGHSTAIARAVEQASDFRLRGVQLNVSAPFHCSLLAPAEAVLREGLDAVDIKPLSVPYVPNVTGAWTVDPSAEQVKNNLVEQVSNPVRWLQTMAAMKEAGVDQWLEVGHGRTLVGFVKRFDRKANLSSFEEEKWRS
ncbi:MAG: ACP S-malonyltransferase [Deltaproteobacteria bacterium]|nr:ACP S-malonyltransferase [Deltaproteobacteria bacterium]